MANILHNTLTGFSFDEDFKELWLYIKDKYGNKIFEIDGVDEKQIDFAENTKQFMTNKDKVSIDPNANISEKGIINYLSEAQKPLLRLNSYYNLYKWIKKTFNTETAKRIIEENISGDIYINDFHLFSVTSYCFGISALDYAKKGLFFLKRPRSAPAKHFQSFIDATIQTITYVSNSIAGAVAISDFLILSYYFIQKDLQTLFKDIPKNTEWYDWYIKQCFQTFIYTINTPLRGGVQSPYTNISVLDVPFLQSMFVANKYTFPDGSVFTENMINGVLKIQELFLDVMQNELKTQPLTFPVITACLTVGNPETLSLNKEIKKEILDINSLKTFVKYNQYAQLNFYVGSPSALSSCCRLKNDYKLLESANSNFDTMKDGYFNSFGASNNLKIGSHRVVAINLPRIAYKSQLGNVSDETIQNRFIDYLEEILNDIYKILHIHRNILKDRINKGLLPLYNYKILELERQFSTVGIVGLYEAIEISLKEKTITSDEGLLFAEKILDFINTKNKEMTKFYHHAHNLEQIPAESASVKLAKKDEIYTKGTLNYPLYSNQVIPLTSTDIIAERIRIQAKLDDKFTGGAILHLNSSNKLTDKQQFELIKLSAEKGISYFAINYVLAECENGHLFISDNHSTKCPICNTEIKEYYTRVVGFLTPVKEAWNSVRKNYEFKKRNFYKDKEWNLGVK